MFNREIDKTLARVLPWVASDKRSALTREVFEDLTKRNADALRVWDSYFKKTYTCHPFGKNKCRVDAGHSDFDSENCDLLYQLKRPVVKCVRKGVLIPPPPLPSKKGRPVSLTDGICVRKLKTSVDPGKVCTNIPGCVWTKIPGDSRAKCHSEEAVDNAPLIARIVPPKVSKGCKLNKKECELKSECEWSKLPGKKNNSCNSLSEKKGRGRPKIDKRCKLKKKDCLKTPGCSWSKLPGKKHNSCQGSHEEEPHEEVHEEPQEEVHEEPQEVRKEPQQEVHEKPQEEVHEKPQEEVHEKPQEEVHEKAHNKVYDHEDQANFVFENSRYKWEPLDISWQEKLHSDLYFVKDCPGDGECQFVSFREVLSALFPKIHDYRQYVVSALEQMPENEFRNIIEGYSAELDAGEFHMGQPGRGWDPRVVDTKDKFINVVRSRGHTFWGDNLTMSIIGRTTQTDILVFVEGSNHIYFSADGDWPNKHFVILNKIGGHYRAIGRFRHKTRPPRHPTNDSIQTIFNRRDPPEELKPFLPVHNSPIPPLAAILDVRSPRIERDDMHNSPIAPVALAEALDTRSPQIERDELPVHNSPIAPVALAEALDVRTRSPRIERVTKRKHGAKHVVEWGDANTVLRRVRESKKLSEKQKKLSETEANTARVAGLLGLGPKILGMHQSREYGHLTTLQEEFPHTLNPTHIKNPKRVASQLVDLIARTADLGIVLLDIKPGNIVTNGDDFRLIDWDADHTSDVERDKSLLDIFTKAYSTRSQACDVLRVVYMAVMLGLLIQHIDITYKDKTLRDALIRHLRMIGIPIGLLQSREAKSTKLIRQIKDKVNHYRLAPPNNTPQNFFDILTNYGLIPIIPPEVPWAERIRIDKGFKQATGSKTERSYITQEYITACEVPKEEVSGATSLKYIPDFKSVHRPELTADARAKNTEEADKKEKQRWIDTLKRIIPFDASPDLSLM
jgi:hypothetical protein